MAHNAVYKVIELGDGIRYGTSKNMDAQKRPHFIDGFNRRPCACRPNAMGAIYWKLGGQLRDRLDSGDMVVCNDGFLRLAGIGGEVL